VLESLVQGVPQVGIPITVDQPGVATRNALSVSRYPVCLNRQFMERMVLS
jgi:UDP:flavonoid glycosyltransferase YjiC (YdhE family)